jgi:hypothetical protein
VAKNRPAGEGASRKPRAHVAEESEREVVCAEQRIVQEG